MLSCSSSSPPQGRYINPYMLIALLDFFFKVTLASISVSQLWIFLKPFLIGTGEISHSRTNSAAGSLWSLASHGALTQHCLPVLVLCAQLLCCLLVGVPCCCPLLKLLCFCMHRASFYFPSPKKSGVVSPELKPPLSISPQLSHPAAAADSPVLLLSLPWSCLSSATPGLSSFSPVFFFCLFFLQSTIMNASAVFQHNRKITIACSIPLLFQTKGIQLRESQSLSPHPHFGPKPRAACLLPTPALKGQCLKVWPLPVDQTKENLLGLIGLRCVSWWWGYFFPESLFPCLAWHPDSWFPSCCCLQLYWLSPFAHPLKGGGLTYSLRPSLSVPFLLNPSSFLLLCLSNWSSSFFLTPL